MAFEPRSAAELDDVLCTLRASLDKCSAERREERLRQLQDLREKYHGSFALSPARFLEWADDVGEERQHEVLLLATNEHRGSVALWMERARRLEPTSWDDSEAVQKQHRVLQDALRVAGQHFVEGHKLWMMSFEHQVKQATAGADADPLAAIEAFVRAQLRVPLRGNRSAFDLYRSTLGDVLPLDELDSLLEDTEKKVAYREAWEGKLARLADQGESATEDLMACWLQYARWEGGSDPRPGSKEAAEPEDIWRAAAVLERALSVAEGSGEGPPHEQASVAQFETLWVELCYLHGQSAQAFEAASRGVKRCPHSPELWKAMALVAHGEDLDLQIPVVMNRAMQQTFPTAHDYLEVMLCCTSSARRALGKAMEMVRSSVAFEASPGKAQIRRAKSFVKRAFRVLRKLYQAALQVMATYYPEWHD
eukprot:scaffold8315_cov277-Pinguiococcus_pyrenoidosus.AAC.1